MQSVNTDTARKGSAPALANPTKSITKIQESLAQYFKKWIRVKTDPCKVSAIRVPFFDLCPCRRLGAQRQHGKLYLWQYSVHTPLAMDKNLNGFHSTLSKTSLANHFSQSLQPPLVLPRRGDADYSGSVKDWLMQITLVLWKTGWCRLLWFCQRQVDAGCSCCW